MSSLSGNQLFFSVRGRGEVAEDAVLGPQTRKAQNGSSDHREGQKDQGALGCTGYGHGGPKQWDLKGVVKHCFANSLPVYANVYCHTNASAIFVSKVLLVPTHPYHLLKLRRQVATNFLFHLVTHPESLNHFPLHFIT